jgi:hypothetical protein
MTAGLVKFKVKHGKTTYSVKELRSVWPYQNPDFDTATYRAFLFTSVSDRSSYSSYIFIAVSPNIC